MFAQRIQLLRSPIDVLTMDETLALVDRSIQARRPLRHVVVNAAKLVSMRKNRALQDSVATCDIINADGQSVVWASKILRKPLPERVAGIDLMQNLVQLAHQRQYRIFFFGARADIVREVVRRYSERYSERIIAGYHHGYFAPEEEAEIAQQIAASQADILFVAISSPKKEIFLHAYKHLINVPFVMGVGGAFDVVAGKVKRAPLWMQRCGLEWLYRLQQEPRRMWKRYLVTNSLFIWYVLQEKWMLPEKDSR